MKIRPGYAKHYLDRSIAYTRMNRRDLALADLDQSIKIDPEYRGAYLLRGAIRFDAKEYALARADFEKVLSLNPGNKVATEGLAKIKALGQ